MIPRWALATFVVAVLGLPIALCIVLGMAQLLAAMEDAAGAAVLGRTALIMALLWAIALVVLVVLLGLEALAPRRNTPGSRRRIDLAEEEE